MVIEDVIASVKVAVGVLSIVTVGEAGRLSEDDSVKKKRRNGKHSGICLKCRGLWDRPRGISLT